MPSVQGVPVQVSFGCSLVPAGKDSSISEEEEALLEGTKDSLLAQVLLELAAQSMEHAGVSW
jgi:hypothetical protein